jgi:hypothetical protein
MVVPAAGFAFTTNRSGVRSPAMTPDELEEAERIFNDGTLIDQALKAAVEEAIRRHAERGGTEGPR